MEKVLFSETFFDVSVSSIIKKVSLEKIPGIVSGFPFPKIKEQLSFEKLTFLTPEI